MSLEEFDIPFDVVVAQDPVAVIVKVHLYLEAFLITLIRGKLERPDALDLDRLTFPSKLGLAIGLGAIPDVAGPALGTINKLRNRVAHDLRATLTP